MEIAVALLPISSICTLEAERWDLWFFELWNNNAFDVNCANTASGTIKSFEFSALNHRQLSLHTFVVEGYTSVPVITISTVRAKSLDGWFRSCGSNSAEEIEFVLASAGTVVSFANGARDKCKNSHFAFVVRFSAFFAIQSIGSTGAETIHLNRFRRWESDTAKVELISALAGSIKTLSKWALDHLHYFLNAFVVRPVAHFPVVSISTEFTEVVSDCWWVRWDFDASKLDHSSAGAGSIESLSNWAVNHGQHAIPTFQVSTLADVSVVTVGSVVTEFPFNWFWCWQNRNASQVDFIHTFVGTIESCSNGASDYGQNLIPTSVVESVALVTIVTIGTEMAEFEFNYCVWRGWFDALQLDCISASVGSIKGLSIGTVNHGQSSIPTSHITTFAQITIVAIVTTVAERWGSCRFANQFDLRFAATASIVCLSNGAGDHTDLMLPTEFEGAVAQSAKFAIISTVGPSRT